MAGATGAKAVGFLQGNSAWTAGAIQVNPVDTTVLVDSGPLVPGNYLFATVIATDTGETADIQYRDAANATNNDSQRRFVPAGQNDDFLFPNKLTLANNERIRIVQVGNLVGNVQASLFWLEVG
jgi:hypothetical protein